MLTANSQCPQGFPQETFEALRNYVMNHRDPGGFLTAVLSNDLMETVLRSSLDCRHSIPQIFEYIFRHCPGNCWGNAEAVKAWVSVPNQNRQHLSILH